MTDPLVFFYAGIAPADGTRPPTK